MIIKEVELLEKLENPNIIYYYGAYLEKEEIYIVFEYCEEGTLNEIYIGL